MPVPLKEGVKRRSGSSSATSCRHDSHYSMTDGVSEAHESSHYVLVLERIPQVLTDGPAMSGVDMNVQIGGSRTARPKI